MLGERRIRDSLKSGQNLVGKVRPLDCAFWFFVCAVSVSCATAPARKNTSACRDDLEATIGLTQRNYAGYLDKVALLGASTLEAASTQARTEAVAAQTALECDKIIRRWLDMFHDGHVSLQVPRLRRPSPPPQRARSEEPALVLDERTIYLTLPSFSVAHKAEIDRLLTANAAAIRARNFMVIDVRGNGGGGDSTYEGLLPYLYTNPIKQAGVELLSTPEIIAGWELLMRDEIPKDAIEARVAIQKLIASLRAAPEGSFVTRAVDSTIEFKNVEAKPSHVAIVTDQECASSCEQFVLDARQSKKVTLVGTRTKGVLDYANVVPFLLPSPEGRIVTLASSRSRRLPAEPVDPTGILPHVPLDTSHVSTLEVRSVPSLLSWPNDAASEVNP